MPVVDLEVVVVVVLSKGGTKICDSEKQISCVFFGARDLQACRFPPMHSFPQ